MRTFFQLKIQAQNIRPSISRTIIIDSRASFKNLHELIQDAFTLYNYHLWIFSFHKKTTLKTDHSGDTIIGPETDEDWNAPDYCADNTKLKEFFSEAKQTFLYWYDFGDDWKFSIELQKIISEYEMDPEIDVGDIPLLLVTQGPDLLEDCGGNQSFADILTVYDAIKNGEPIRQSLLEAVAANLGIADSSNYQKEIFNKVKKLYDNAYPPGRPLTGQTALLT